MVPLEFGLRAKSASTRISADFVLCVSLKRIQFRTLPTGIRLPTPELYRTCWRRIRSMACLVRSKSNGSATMNLYLLRHGLAVEAGTSEYSKDSERPLTPKGERKLWKIAEAMEDMELSFDWILSSPYVRARQTAQIVAEALSLRKKLEITETLTPAGSTKKLVESIHQKQPSPKDILLVGHEPYLSELISLLVSGHNELAISMKKGGLCNLAIEALEYGRCARLDFLLTPKQMCLMA